MSEVRYTQRLISIVFFWSIAFLLTSFGMAYHTYMRGLPVPLLSADSLEHIEAIEYFFKQGNYWPDLRMPSIGILYGIFYLLTKDRSSSVFLLSITFFVIILASVITSIIYGYNYTKRAWVAHGIGLMWTTAPIGLYWYWMVPDVIMAALSVIAIVALLRGRYVLAGIMITGLFFLRPLAGVLLIAVFIYLWLTHESLRGKIKAIALTLLPLVVAESSWVARNYLRYRDFRPFWGTGTLTNAGIDLPYSTALLLYRHLGTGGAGSRGMIILMEPRKREIKDFLKLFPAGYFSKREEELIEGYLRILGTWSEDQNDSARCEIMKALEAQTNKILSEAHIPWLRRRISSLIQALFSEVINESGSFHSNWLIGMAKLPFYTWASVSFVSAFLFFTLLMIICLFRGGLTLSHLLWYGFGTLGPLAHFIIGLMEQRYLIQYYPTLCVGSILMIASCFAKK